MPINIVSECPQKFKSPLDFLLAYLDKKASINGDGIVSKLSQQFLTFPNTIEVEIEATHATSLKKGIKIAKRLLNF